MSFTCQHQEAEAEKADDRPQATPTGTGRRAEGDICSHLQTPLTPTSHSSHVMTGVLVRVLELQPEPPVQKKNRHRAIMLPSRHSG